MQPKDSSRDTRRTRTIGGRRRSERGASLLEFALVFPFLIALVLGLLTSAFALSYSISLTAAAREGARFGATLPIDQCDVVLNCSGNTWAQLVRTVAIDRTGGELNASGVCVALVTGPGSAPQAVSPTHTTAGGNAPCFNDGSADTGRRVQIRLVRPTRVQALFVGRDILVTGRATSRYEQ